MASSNVRGSDKLLKHLFAGSTVSKKDLAKVVSAAKTSDGLKIVKWWWYGQPAIERIIAMLHVENESVGETVDALVATHSAAVQVGLEVFPLGLPRPEFTQIQVTLSNNVKSVG